MRYHNPFKDTPGTEKMERQEKNNDSLRTHFFGVISIFAVTKVRNFVKDTPGIEPLTVSDENNLNFNLLPPVENSDVDQGSINTKTQISKKWKNRKPQK